MKKIPDLTEELNARMSEIMMMPEDIETIINS